MKMFKIIMLALLIFTLKPEVKAVNTEDYTVSAGETLWSIACENADSDVRKYIYELRELNNLEDCTIYPGEVIKIIK